MGDRNTQICRLCLEKRLACACEKIDETKKEMLLKVLLIDINFNITADAVACCGCLEKFQECLDFKLQCIATLMELLTCRGPLKKPPESSDFKSQCIAFIEAYNEGGLVMDTSKYKQKSLQNGQICPLCTSPIEDSDLSCITDLRADALLEMFTNCLPEVPSSLNTVHAICKPCLNSLAGYYKFMKSCEDVELVCKLTDRGATASAILEEMLKSKDCDELDTPVIIEEEYSDVEDDAIAVTTQDKEPIAGIKGKEIHKEANLSDGEEKGDSVPLGARNNNYSVKTSSLQRKRQIRKSASKGRNYSSSDNHTVGYRGLAKVFGCQECTFKTDRKYILARHMLRHEHKSEVEKPKSVLSPYKTQCKSGINHQLSHKTDPKSNLYTHNVILKDKSENGMYKCENCDFKTRYKFSMKRHMLKHRDSKEKIKFKYDKCLYETDIKSDLDNHNLVDKDISKVDLQKCEICEFETRFKYSMVRHMLKHRDSVAERKFKCDKCPYETDSKSSLRRHTEMHKDKSEVEMLKCEICDFETRYKYSMVRHIPKHRDSIAERKVHHDSIADRKVKYDECLYETDIKSILENHNLIHKDRSEVEIYKCANCEFQTRYKRSLNRHMLKHRDSGAARKFKCDTCSFETNFKSSLRGHNMMHKDKSEVDMYKCENCDFETRHKQNMIPHLQKHRDLKLERRFKCDQCPYETDIKCNLFKHNQKHKDRSEVEMYKCANCEFETRYKRSVIQHMLQHRDSTAERKFKCDRCSYETNFKSSMRGHNLIHMDKTEVEMQKCDQCDFVTKHKRSIIRHMLQHRDSYPKAERKF